MWGKIYIHLGRSIYFVVFVFNQSSIFKLLDGFH